MPVTAAARYAAAVAITAASFSSGEVVAETLLATPVSFVDEAAEAAVETADNITTGDDALDADVAATPKNSSPIEFDNDDPEVDPTNEDVPRLNLENAAVQSPSADEVEAAAVNSSPVDLETDTADVPPAPAGPAVSDDVPPQPPAYTPEPIVDPAFTPSPFDIPPPPVATRPAPLSEPLGPAPPADGNLQFLRQQSVLLERGESQFDFGLGYAIFEEDVPAVFGTTLGENRARGRLLLSPLAVRYGLTDRVQMFASLPVGWAQTDVAFPGAFDDSTNGGGIGDLDLGLNIHLHRGNGCDNNPDVVFTVAGTVPTSDADFFDAFSGTTALNLGDDFAALRWDLLFIHTYDPVVVFYGLGSRHRFTRNFGPFEVEPGAQFLYQLGVGFAVNDRVTLSGRVAGQYITEVHVDGDSIEGSVQEPIGVRFAVTILRNCYLVEPFVEIGMTRDSPEAFTGITWTY
ncbi:MAG: transporter [Planctomycetota bacterium]